MSLHVKTLARLIMSGYLRRIGAFVLCTFIAHSAGAINVVLQQVQAPGTFTRSPTGQGEPLYAINPGDGTDRLFVVQHAGIIRVMVGGVLQASNFINLGVGGLALCSNATSNDEHGLWGLAFHPNYATNGFFYVSYSRASDSAWIIQRFTNLPSTSNVVTNLTPTTILGPIADLETNHNGGMIAFGPDGYLYASLGDGGGSGDMHGTIGNAQDTTVLYGKIHRLDVDGGTPYAIPPTNPFFGSATNRPEIYAYGLRNTWRFSFDDGPGGTGRLFAADVGQGSREEIDLITLGGNFGWRRMEGVNCFNPATGCQTGSLILPIHDYSSAGAATECSVTGGFVYRGIAYPGLNGLYFYADYCSHNIWTLQETSPGVFSNTLRATAATSVAGFGRDRNGELYVCGFGNGALYRITDTDPPPTPSPTPSVSPTVSPSPTASPSPTPSRTPTPSPSASPSPTNSPTPTASMTPSPSSTPGPTASPTPSASPSPSPTASPTVPATPTISPTVSPSPTANSISNWELYE